MQVWSHTNWGMVETARWPSFSDLTCTLWLEDAGNFSESRCNGRGFAKREMGARARKKTPEVIEHIAGLLKHDKAGDPVHGLKWTRKTTRKIARQLRRLDIRISASTVGRLLKKMGFSLRVNHKRLECGNKNPPPRRVRNRQFKYIKQMREESESRGSPVVSIDTKKKELVGKFKNNGVSWEITPYLALDHDFPSDAKGIGIPYGIYDTQANLGFVVVGTSHETPAFAVDAIVLWWKDCGRSMYPKT